MALKAIIRQGDPTSHGGTVIEAFPTFEIFGKPASGIGHKVSCPKCKGIFPIIAGVEKVSYLGKDVAVEGMKTACGAALIATQQQVKAEAPTGAATAPVFAPTKNTPVASTLAHSESNPLTPTAKGEPHELRFQAIDLVTSEPLAYRPYVISRTDGSEKHGVTDSNGFSEIIQANEAEEVAFHCEFKAPKIAIPKSNLS